MVVRLQRASEPTIKSGGDRESETKLIFVKKGIPKAIHHNYYWHKMEIVPQAFSGIDAIVSKSTCSRQRSFFRHFHEYIYFRCVFDCEGDTERTWGSERTVLRNIMPSEHISFVRFY